MSEVNKKIEEGKETGTNPPLPFNFFLSSLHFFSLSLLSKCLEQAVFRQASIESISDNLHMYTSL